MGNEVNKSNFNICDQVKMDKAINIIECAVANGNKLLMELKDNGLSDFLTFDIAMSIIKDGKEGIKTLTNDVIKEAQSRVLLTKEKDEAKAKYTKFFAPYQTKADIVRRSAYIESRLLDLNLFTWDNSSKEIGLIKGYKAKIEPLFKIEAKDYHYAYMERLEAYVKAKNELYKYHALVYAHDYPSRSGLIRLRGVFKDEDKTSFNSDTLEYSPISLDKLLLTSIHEPDNGSLLKEKIVTNW